MRLRGWGASVAMGLACGVYEAATWGFVPLVGAGVRPIVPVLAVLILYDKGLVALVTGVVAGLVGDLFAVDAPVLRFGLYPTLAILAGLVSRHVFTNRSVYASVAVCLVLRSAEQVWLVLANLLRDAPWNAGLPVSGPGPWWSVFAWDAFLVVATFLIGLLLRRSRRWPERTVTSRHPWYA